MGKTIPPKEKQHTVIFREWIDGRFKDTVVVIFPKVPANINGKLCVSYESTFGWGEVNGTIVMSNTRRMDQIEAHKTKEYKYLSELGYKLNIRNRFREKYNKIRETIVEEQNKSVSSP